MTSQQRRKRASGQRKPMHVDGLAGLFPGATAATASRAELLARMSSGKIPQAWLIQMIVSAEGIECLTTHSLRLLAGVLELVEMPADTTDEPEFLPL